MKTIYSTKVTSHGGRDGTVRSSDGLLDLQVTSPKGGQQEGTNPEQLFAAGYAACFHSALKMTAKNKSIDADQSEVTAEVALLEKDGFQLSVKLIIRIPGASQAEAKEIAQLAHDTCPYSKAIKNNIEVDLQVAG
ncbi:organic hydroperoxide resistance protein [Paenibacillus senegalensis]|uniref:organic hydroperoxide resistance protein n=1 Tax=Paenibacillus senegalensis TaxID=1465766 RepID=UPI0002EBD117